MLNKRREHPESIDEQEELGVKSDDCTNTLAYSEEKKSFVLDVEDDDPDYHHPMDYTTIAQGATDDDSRYDNSNPYVGKEYANRKEIFEEDLDDLGMRVAKEELLHVHPVDRQLAETEEDFRDDLDSEGYPKNDRKKS
ncbi:hypothetical protein [Rhinopithecimicrobium faecis]|uniref:hypothetical protein n=1 Tax=Rhinopithecimicrobium faecis TaxID=2820698 RepID=UPI00336543F8